MTQKTYTMVHNHVCDVIEEAAVEKMAEAANEEKELAIAASDIGRDGIPEITVVCDGIWAKRSYRSNYSSASGAAAII